MTRKEILQNYCVKVTCDEDVERLNKLENNYSEIDYKGKGCWSWLDLLHIRYYGNEDGELRSENYYWGKTFNSVDEFEQFLKAEELKPKFKVGDKVRIVAEGIDHKVPIGTECEIIGVLPPNGYRHEYRYDTGHIYCPWIIDSCAELIEEPEKQESYREYKGIKFPTDVDEFLENGPYCDEDVLRKYIATPPERGGMPLSQYDSLKTNLCSIFFSSLTTDLIEYWDSKKENVEFKVSGEGLLGMIRKESPSPNPLSKLTCKSKSKSLDLKPKKINEVKLNIKK